MIVLVALIATLTVGWMSLMAACTIRAMGFGRARFWFALFVTMSFAVAWWTG